MLSSLHEFKFEGQGKPAHRLLVAERFCLDFGFQGFGGDHGGSYLFLSLYITWLGRADRSELAHNLAISCWITANAIWMFGEFYFDDSKRHWAMPFFVAGLCILALHYLRLGLERLKS